MIQKFIQSDLLLNLVGNEIVGWFLMKMVSSYKYVGLFV
jgi:hypothetical protein